METFKARLVRGMLFGFLIFLSQVTATLLAIGIEKMISHPLPDSVAYFMLMFFLMFYYPFFFSIKE